MSTGLDPTIDIDFEDFRLGREVHAMPLEEQAKAIKDAGLEGQVKPTEGYRPEALDIVIENKRLENAAAFASENQGIGGTIAGFGAGLAASFMDPINLASAFVPVPGQARVMSLMAGASGIGQRAAIRAGLGAASGALGAAMIEPMIYLGQQEVQADYTFANSMLNMAFGAVMGGVLHSSGGTFAEWRRARSRQPQPWEYVPPDDASTALMDAHAEDFAKYRLEANPDLDPAWVREEAITEAQLFNQRARNWAYHEKKTVAEYYGQNRPEYRSWQPGFERVDDTAGFEWREGSETGKAQEDVLYHAMYRNKAETIDEFLGKHDQLVQNKSNTYYDFQHRKIKRQDGLADNYEVWLGVDQVSHIKNRHPNFNDWDKIPDVLENGKSQLLGPNRVTGGGPTYLFTVKDGDKSIAVIGAPVESNNRGNRVMVLTAFRDSDAGIENWVKRFKKEEAASSQGSGGSPANPSPHGDDLPGSESGNTNILNQNAPVKPSLTGKQTEIIGSNGSREVGRYEVRELDDIIASHDPDNQFRRRDNYPKIAQERPYHSDIGEQIKVIGNARDYAPARTGRARL